MTYTTMNAPVAPFGAITAHRMIAAVEGLMNSIRAWNDTRRTVAVLRSLSADQLEDIGLTGADVEKFGRTGF